uniref:Uncharacterized protein n=1 Tax=Ditylenchus dipsaci TaxID=166011 RepID=A0A915DKD3_9BILA
MVNVIDTQYGATNGQLQKENDKDVVESDDDMVVFEQINRQLQFKDNSRLRDYSINNFQPSSYSSKPSLPAADPASTIHHLSHSTQVTLFRSTRVMNIARNSLDAISDYSDSDEKIDEEMQQVAVSDAEVVPANRPMELLRSLRLHSSRCMWFSLSVMATSFRFFMDCCLTKLKQFFLAEMITAMAFVQPDEIMPVFEELEEILLGEIDLDPIWHGSKRPTLV